MNKLLNVSKLIKRIWIILWVILGILLILKFCFNIWYPIVIKNQGLINICNFIDERMYLRISMNLILYLINIEFMFLICTMKKKVDMKLFLLIAIISIPISVSKNYSQFLPFIFEVFLIIVFPIIYNIKNKTFKSKTFMNILLPIIMNVLLMLWQLNVLFVRNLSEILTSESALIVLVMQLDYYIFLIITYIGVCHMGAAGLWFWGKSKTELEAIKAEELKKENPDAKLLEELDEAIKEAKE